MLSMVLTLLFPVTRQVYVITKYQQQNYIIAFYFDMIILISRLNTARHIESICKHVPTTSDSNKSLFPCIPKLLPIPIIAWRLYVHKYPPLSIARYSFIQPSELEQCRVNELAQGSKRQQEDSNPDFLHCEFDALTTCYASVFLLQSACIDFHHINTMASSEMTDTSLGWHHGPTCIHTTLSDQDIGSTTD